MQRASSAEPLLLQLWANSPVQAVPWDRGSDAMPSFKLRADHAGMLCEGCEVMQANLLIAIGALIATVTVLVQLLPMIARLA